MSRTKQATRDKAGVCPTTLSFDGGTQLRLAGTIPTPPPRRLLVVGYILIEAVLREIKIMHVSIEFFPLPIKDGSVRVVLYGCGIVRHVPADKSRSQLSPPGDQAVIFGYELVLRNSLPRGAFIIDLIRALVQEAGSFYIASIESPPMFNARGFSHDSS